MGGEVLQFGNLYVDEAVTICVKDVESLSILSDPLDGHVRESVLLVSGLRTN